MNIKVCGITTLKQVQQLDGLDIDFAGFIFYKVSPRYMRDKISGSDLVNADFDIKKVGVFVNAGYDEIIETVEEYSLDMVQLHGNETPDFCADLTEEIEVIKSFSIDDSVADVDEMILEYDDACDYYLFDTKRNGSSGGTGMQFDWNKLLKAKIEKPFFLSGGIGPGDEEKIRKFNHPDFYAVDINSRFEKVPGEKDMAAILQFKKGLK